MKRTLLTILGPAVGVVAIVLVFLIIDDRPVVPIVADCGFDVSDSLVKSGGGSLSTNKWTVYAYGGVHETPFVAVEQTAAQDRNTTTNAAGCTLTIVTLPPEGARTLDWRIGKTATDIKPFAGKTLRFTLSMKSDEAATFGSASIYIFDGEKVTSHSISRLSENWENFEVIAKISHDATAVEFWFRLLFDTPNISPRENKLYLTASLEEATEEDLKISNKTNHSQPAGKPNWRSASCPVVASPAFIQAAGIGYSQNKWLVYRHDVGNTAPIVEISTVPGGGPDGETVCRLSISNGPENPSSAIDWRMGNLAGVEGLRGKKVQFKVKIRADQDMSLNTSYIYSYFGGDSKSDSTSSVTEQWIEKSVTFDVPENATNAEFWYRLVLDRGTILPGSGTIIFLPELTILN